MNFMYGTDVAAAIYQAARACECCGERDSHKIFRIPPMMGGPLLTAEPSDDDPFICKACFSIWYDCASVDPEEIGRIHRERRVAGKYPFNSLSTQLRAAE